MILVGHGSKAKAFDRTMRRVAKELTPDYFDVRLAYLEINIPSITDAIRQAVCRGAKNVRVVPYFLLAGNHVRKDIPLIVKEAQKRWKGVAKIRLCDYLGFDKRIVAVVRDRAGV